MIITKTIDNNPNLQFSFEDDRIQTCVFSYEVNDIQNPKQYMIVNTNDIEGKLATLQQNRLGVKLVMCGTSASYDYLCRHFTRNRARQDTANIFQFTADELDIIKRMLSGQIKLS